MDGPEDAERCRELLAYRGYDDVSPGMPSDWYYCLGKGSHSPGFHLHLVKEGSLHHLKHIIFRDWLRTHPKDADAYRDLKIELSEKYRNDMVAYTERNTTYIDGIVMMARKSRALRPS